jgi:hypothetical protein
MAKLPFPRKVLEQHTIVLGKTRSGKSSTMRLAVEDLLDRSEPVCIIDPKGDWWGLKSSADGKSPGYEIVIFGGKHGDVPINAASGKAVAELVAQGNRPCLIDLGGWMVGERTRFFIDFMSALFNTARGNRWIVIDECHNFAPQGKAYDVDTGKMLHWANRLASEGAGKGMILISASQRPQKVHKDYVTSHETLIAKRVIHPLDRSAMKDWIDGCGDPALGKEVLDTLAGLQRNQGWVWSPEIGFGPKLVDFPMFATYDSFAAPKNGASDRKLKGWADVDLEEVKTKLAAAIAEHQANDPKSLKAETAKQKTEIAKLTAELDRLKNAPSPAPDKADVAAAEARAKAQGKVEGYREAVAALQPVLGKLSKFVVPLKDASDVIDGVTMMAEVWGEKANELQLLLNAGRLPSQAIAAPRAASPPPSRPAPPLSKRQSPPNRSWAAGVDVPLTGPQRQLLEALAWWKTMGHDAPTRPQVAAIAGWKPKGSNLRNRLSELSSNGLVSYPADGKVSLTAIGEASAPAPDTSRTLIDSIRAVCTGPQQAIFDQLLAFRDQGHSPVTRAYLAQALGWEPGGSNLRNRLSELSAIEVVEYPTSGMVQLQDWVVE